MRFKRKPLKPAIAAPKVTAKELMILATKAVEDAAALMKAALHAESLAAEHTREEHRDE